MSVSTRLSYFIVYGSRDVTHLERILLPALDQQSVPAPRSVWLLNFENNVALSSFEGRYSNLEVTDVSAQRRPGQTGFGESVNTLFDIVKPQPHFFLLNPDTVPHAGFSAALLATMQGHRVGIAEARQWPAEHPKEYDPESGETPWASGACLLISSQAFSEIHGFDTNFFLYCEDVDLSWRMWLSNWRVIYSRDAVCEHHTGLHSYTVDRFYPEHFYSAIGFLGLSWKFFGAVGEERALRLFREVGYPNHFSTLVKRKFADMRKKIVPLDDKPMPPWVRVEGYNLYHKFAWDVLTEAAAAQ